MAVVEAIEPAPEQTESVTEEVPEMWCVGRSKSCRALGELILERIDLSR